jgi:type II secretory pathway component GspD/PulD (secretin)
VPGLSDVPAAGALFNNTTKNHATREMVVVLRARVVS